MSVLTFTPADEDTVPLSVHVVAAGGVVGPVGEELPQAATERQGDDRDEVEGAHAAA